MMINKNKFERVQTQLSKKWNRDDSDLLILII